MFTLAVAAFPVTFFFFVFTFVISLRSFGCFCVCHDGCLTSFTQFIVRFYVHTKTHFVFCSEHFFLAFLLLLNVKLVSNINGSYVMRPHFFLLQLIKYLEILECLTIFEHRTGEFLFA